jgi:hypothetical protein
MGTQIYVIKIGRKSQISPESTASIAGLGTDIAGTEQEPA